MGRLTNVFYKYNLTHFDDVTKMDKNGGFGIWAKGFPVILCWELCHGNSDVKVFKKNCT